MANVHSGILSEMLSFLEPTDADSYQLVCNKWDKIIRHGEWFLPRTTIDSIEFARNYDVILQHGIQHNFISTICTESRDRWSRQTSPDYSPDPRKLSRWRWERFHLSKHEKQVNPVKILEEEENHLDCATCPYKYELLVSNMETHAFLFKKYVFRRMRLYFLDDLLFEILRNIVKLSGQRLHVKKLMFIPHLPCNNLKTFKEMILPFFKNLSEILSRLIFVDDLYVDLSPSEFQFLIEMFPAEEFNMSNDTNLYISVRNSGIPYELNENSVKKLLCGHKIFKSPNLNLHRMECENFCEIYLKTFKEANDPEVFFKIIQLDGCFAKDFQNQIKNFEGIQKYRQNNEIEDDEEDEEDEEDDEESEGENTYIVKRPDFWTLKIQLELEELEPLLKDYFYEERSILIGDPIIFYTQFRGWDDLPNTEIISWREAKKRDIKRKRSKDWEVTRWHTYQHRDDGILEVQRIRLDDQEENIFVVTSATFEVFFDTKGHKKFHKI